MENQLFRKESMDRISSPEQLHDYMRVTSPRMWMLLSAVAALLIGFIVFASTTTMESKLNINVLAQYGVISADLPPAQSDLVSAHMPVRIAGRTGEVGDIYRSEKLRLQISFDSGAELEDGYYTMEFAESENAPEDLVGSSVYLTVNNGIISASQNTSNLMRFCESDRRVVIDGKPATITEALLFDASTVTIELDNPETALPDGVYNAEIVTESITPIKFLTN